MQECLVVPVHGIEVLDQPQEASAVEGLECRLDGLPAWQRDFFAGHAQKPSAMNWCLRLPNVSWLRARSPFALSADVCFAPQSDRLLRCHEMSRWAHSYTKQPQQTQRAISP